MKYEPLVSVIMPSYNSTETISDSIESVLAQTYQNWELLITDDVSVDDTKDIVRRYCDKDKRIKLFELDTNSGAGASRNNSINNSSGDYIAFLDSDDLWLPNKLLLQIEFMEKEQVLFSFTAYSKFSSTGDGIIVTPPDSVTYEKLLTGNVIGCLTAVYNAKIIGRRFMPLIRKRQDMGLWLSILKDVSVAHSIPDVLAKYRTDSGMTQNKFSILRWQWLFYRDHLGFSVLKTLYFFSMYIFNALKKY